MNHKSRIAKLEEQHAPDVARYLCILYPDKEITVTPYGAGGPRQRFADRAALDEFAARPDVDLTIVEIHYASEQENKYHD